jgi:hypothetical protein
MRPISKSSNKCTTSSLRSISRTLHGVIIIGKIFISVEFSFNYSFYKAYWLELKLQMWLYTSRNVTSEHQAIMSKLGSIGPFGHQLGAQMGLWNQALIL